MSQEIQVSVDTSRCIGSRMCVLEAPEVFTMNEEEGHSTASSTPVERTEGTWAAVEFCPREAIVARDASTGEQLFP